MTRSEKYKKLRACIEIENYLAKINNFKEWLYVKENQEEIKKEIGARH